MVQPGPVRVPGFEPLATADEDYSAVIVRLTWAIRRGRKTDPRYLIVGAVELVPHEIPLPVPVAPRQLELSDRYILYASDVVTSVKDGLDWFNATESGISVRPDRNGQLWPADDPRALFFETSSWSPHPLPPTMLTPKLPVPFVTRWNRGPRVRHLITTRPQEIFTEKERRAATKWLEKEVNVDLDLWPEFWGSAHLIAPNPIFRSIVMHCQVDESGRTVLATTIVPREGRSVDGLRLHVEEDLVGGGGVLASVTIREPVTRIALPRPPRGVRECVVDERRGVLWNSGDFAFFGGFEVALSIGAQERRTVPAEEPEDDEFTVTLQNREPARTIKKGIAPPPAAEVMMRAASSVRARRQRAATEQAWFRDQAPEGVKALRAVVGNVAGEVIICDPYFGGRDIRNLVSAVANPSARVRVLASAMHLHREREKEEITEGDFLQDRLAHVRTLPSMSEVEIRVMPGKKADIHDRFLWTGERLWMLGSSINRFGGRGTLMVVVPDHEPVLADIERVYAMSPTLSQWLATHRRRKRSRFRKWLIAGGCKLGKKSRSSGRS